MLYHGSNHNIAGNTLIPHISFDYKPYVYATDDFAYAIVRCGKFDIEDIAIKEDYIDKDHRYTLVELRPNAFKDIFDVSGVVYFVDEEDFIKKGNEYVSNQAARITNRIHIDNVWSMIVDGPFAHRYRLIPYTEKDSYFKSNNIDYDAYIARRKARIKILNEKISYEKFLTKYCAACGSQRCGGAHDELFRDGCPYYLKEFNEEKQKC